MNQINDFRLVILSFAVLFFCTNCKDKKDKEKMIVNKFPPLESIIEKKRIDTIIERKLSLLNFEDSFIGKTNLNLKDNNYHTCLGLVIDRKYSASKYEFAISIIAKELNNCNNGQNKIVLEKFLRRESRKAIFEIVAEKIVESNSPELCYSPISLILSGTSEEKMYLLAYKNNQKKILEDIFKLWEIDFENMKFKVVEIPKGLICENPDYAEGL